MGKRKDRRIAAHAIAGRRVKLDLLPEPSGDFGVSSEHDKVGENIDPTQHPGLPESPSSSGKQPQNPLQLLGQYSDDELDDESNKDSKQANLDEFRSEHNSKDERTHDKLCENIDGDSVKVASVNLEQHEMDEDSFHVDDSKIMESHISRATDADNDRSKDLASSLEQNSISGNPHEKMVGDVSLGWKMVLHEESNQYYYWNVETGETSWEVPNDWAQCTEMGLDQNTIDVNENTEIVSAGPNMSDSTIVASLTAKDINGSTVDHFISQSKVVNYSGHCLDMSTLGTESNSGEVDGKSSAVPVSHDNLAAVDNSVQYSVNDKEDSMEADLPARLVNMCECLLDRLKSLAGSRSQLDRHDWISKYTLEIGIRHYDISSLISCGSSVLPFWVHSERQLKQVENAINLEIYQMAISAQMDIAEAICSSPDIVKAKTERNHGLESDAKKHEENAVHSASEVVITTSADSLSDAGKSSYNETGNINNAHEELASSVGLARDSLNATVVYEHANQNSLSGEQVSDQGYHEEEDIDMDVDMEVEDETTTSSMALGDPSYTRDFSAAPPYEQLIQQNSPVDYQLLMSSNALTHPPPPDEGWVPPPPPDDDMVPPPPPDNELDPPQPPNEPTTSLYSALPSYAGIGQPFSYSGQYNIAYPDSSFHYYGDAVTDVMGNNLYGHADGYQVVLPQTSLYGVPHTYVDTAPIAAPVSYAPPIPGTARLESLQFHNESDPKSSVISSVNAFTNDASTANVDISGVHEEATSSLSVPLNSATIQAPAFILAKDSMSELATTATATVAAASLLTSKAPSKVLRSKKRTVPVASSLRSNKKVSSMVDKWKAAKEELNVKEDDEPDNQLEILEKKRQREIKEWRDQLIASGEAKSNANFQPLGGDWRERVKRRRAKTAKEVVESPSETRVVENKQPELTELSKGLPSLWQAYWDESTQKVYYGHKITLETTWTRPTK